MMNGKRYKVAGHRFSVELPDGFSCDKYFAPYRPFEDVETGDDEPVFTLRLTFTDTLPMAEAGDFVRCFHEEAPKPVILYGASMKRRRFCGYIAV